MSIIKSFSQQKDSTLCCVQGWLARPSQTQGIPLLPPGFYLETHPLEEAPQTHRGKCG